MPATWMRTPFAGTIPFTARWKPVDETITRRGTTPARTTSAGP